jgi:hypothetical protein
MHPLDDFASCSRSSWCWAEKGRRELMRGRVAPIGRRALTDLASSIISMIDRGSGFSMSMGDVGSGIKDMAD